MFVFRKFGVLCFHETPMLRFAEVVLELKTEIVWQQQKLKLERVILKTDKHFT